MVVFGEPLGPGSWPGCPHLRGPRLSARPRSSARPGARSFALLRGTPRAARALPCGPGDLMCRLVPWGRDVSLGVPASLCHPRTPHAASARLLLRVAVMKAAHCLKNYYESPQKLQKNAQNPSGWKEPQRIIWANPPA